MSLRLWHVDLISYLPKSQLLAQWRELNSIFVKEDKHVLINYIYDYPKSELYAYTNIVMDEMKKRGFNIRTFDKMQRYFEGETPATNDRLFKSDHNDLYLTICYYNLYEKYWRGQKDFSEEQFHRLQQFYKKQIETWI